MKLTQFTNTRVVNAVRALRENYDINLRLEKLDKKGCQTLLKQVREVMAESKSKPGQAAKINSQQHMKLVFMEQALSGWLKYLNSRVPTIVVENKEVSKSESFLAAQEMANSLQDVVEEISDMLNKELPALVQSIETNIGIKESQAFKQSVTEVLNNLLNSVKESTDNMNTAVNALTGGEMPDMGAPAMPAPAGGESELPEMPGGGETPAVPELPEPPSVPGAGRERR